MTNHLGIALIQLNPTVGDLAGNLEKIRHAYRKAAAEGVDLVISSELVVTGYPPEDLMLKPSFQEAAEKAVHVLAAELTGGAGPGLLIGAPWRDGDALYNASLLLDDGKVVHARFKHDLPNYGVFDERRIFSSGPLPGPVNFRGVRLGIMLCEDMWTSEVTECLVESGAEILVVLNGSPFEVDKPDQRLNFAVARSVESGLPLIYTNQVGGQDELVFDGGSFVIGHDRTLAARAVNWCEEVMITHWHRDKSAWICEAGPMAGETSGTEAIYQALLLGLRDYVTKNGFPGVLIGLSGGIDSALTAALAVDALGGDRVHGIRMPSPYTSPASLEDAEILADNLGMRLDTISIEPAMAAFDAMLKELFAGQDADATEENIQARARGMTLMALSNKFGRLVLSTGNKSEMSVGYATLYGDMAGGFAILKDVYKTTVYECCRWRNANFPEGALGPKGMVIPDRILTKAPSAELKPDQCDQDTLPPYEDLDAILSCLIEKDMSVDEIADRGYDRKTVSWVWKMLDIAEYKRRQAPPGVKITSRSFGRDRRYPITNRYKGLA
ncbi:MAG: NAD+ synthase [Rhodospirillaceae bacterium]|nr:MAG: NAD+ synthase [Rhodospirillaceae bacterium]